MEGVPLLTFNMYRWWNIFDKKIIWAKMCKYCLICSLRKLGERKLSIERNILLYITVYCFAQYALHNNICFRKLWIRASGRQNLCIVKTVINVKMLCCSTALKWDNLKARCFISRIDTNTVVNQTMYFTFWTLLLSI